jgi:xanthine dehydrogenase YagR molybdenum-binding subunit
MSAIGQPLRRPDGPAKLTGTAPYSADRDDIERRSDLVHATLVTAAVPGGRIAELDVDAARAAPGVVAVLTAADMPRMTMAGPPLGTSILPMQDDVVRYEGQPIALVAAPSRQQAEHAARLVHARYTDLVPATSFGAGAVVAPDGMHNLAPNDVDLGDFDAGLAAADVVVQGTYSTADRHHNPIEPSSTLAWWSGNELTVQDSVQGISAVRAAMAATFGIPADHVHVS